MQSSASWVVNDGESQTKETYNIMRERGPLPKANVPPSVFNFVNPLTIPPLPSLEKLIETSRKVAEALTKLPPLVKRIRVRDQATFDRVRSSFRKVEEHQGSWLVTPIEIDPFLKSDFAIDYEEILPR